MVIFNQCLNIKLNKIQKKLIGFCKSEIEKLELIINFQVKENTYDNTFSNVVEFIIKNKPYLLYRLVRTKNWSIRLDIATKIEQLKIKWLREKIIIIFSTDKNNIIRALISILPSTPLDVLNKLANDKVPFVAEEAKSNDKLINIYANIKNY